MAAVHAGRVSASIRVHKKSASCMCTALHAEQGALGLLSVRMQRIMHSLCTCTQPCTCCLYHGFGFNVARYSFFMNGLDMEESGW